MDGGACTADKDLLVDETMIQMSRQLEHAVHAGEVGLLGGGRSWKGVRVVSCVGWPPQGEIQPRSRQ